jgi:[protein-PII] uridylyltransferase
VLTSETLPSLSGRARGEQAAACRVYLDRARENLSARYFRGIAEGAFVGDEAARGWAEAVDTVVRALFSAARTAFPSLEVSLVAVGGYGRSELCPYSDLDLWFVVPSSRDREATQLAEAVLYPLWDLRMEVGHAVRTPSEAIDQAKDDLTAMTALLDVRFLDGDRGPWEKLEREIPKLFGRDPNKFVRRLKEEKEGRHARFGDTVYLLEPNLKNGEGGYRDLMVGLWAVRARFGVRDFPELVAQGQASERQARALMEARRFFLTVRIAAHLAAGRKADRLTFEIQEAIAPQLFPKVREPGEDAEVKPAVAPAVEALMQRYFLDAKAVKRETTRLLERCLVDAARKPVTKPLGDGFQLWNGLLTCVDREAFRKRPSEWVRIFNVALESGAEIHGRTKEVIADGVDKVGLALRNDAAAQKELLKLLLDDRDQRSPSLLEQTHELGLLAALMPEFAPCTARVQHDLYHVFTVDQHQLYAVGQLKALARGELKDELPVTTAALADVTRRAPLYLGTLLHDVGKPLGKGHSETGARLAVAVATRLGLPPADVSQTEFLVRKHLLLSHLSQRRDLNDVAMIANLAKELGDPESLRELFILTVADMSMVAPGNLTGWKAQLLRELFVRTMAHYRHGPDLAGSDESDVVVQRRQKVAELLGETAAAPSLEAWFASLPDRYVTANSPRDIATHIQLSRKRAGTIAVQVTHHPRKQVTELAVCADDAPGLLQRIAGVLVANRIDVLDAQINSRDGGEVLDVFTTRDRYGRAITDEKRWQRVEEDLKAVLAGTINVEALIAERRDKSGLPERVTPAVRTEIEVDNDVSADFSVVDVYTQDRLGVLYAITRTLSSLALDIQLSKVATEADRVADVFYVREEGGGKLSHPRVDELKLALGEALGALQAGR